MKLKILNTDKPVAINADSIQSIEAYFSLDSHDSNELSIEFGLDTEIISCFDMEIAIYLNDNTSYYFSDKVDVKDFNLNSLSHADILESVLSELRENATNKLLRPFVCSLTSDKFEISVDWHEMRQIVLNGLQKLN